MKLIKTRPVFFCLFVLFCFCFHFIVCFFKVLMTAHTYVSHHKNIISKCYLHDIFFIPLLDCKTVRILACSSTRELSNRRSGTRLGRFARVRLLRHALPISLLILRKKTDCFAVYTFTGAFRVCLKELIYNLSTEFT